MKGLLESKKNSLEYDLENQKINKTDMEEAQKAADKALNDYLVGKEAHYEIEKIKINAKIEFIDEILKEIE
jgi:hypothetical protein